MFENPRYLSKGVNTKVSIFVQMLMWDMIDEMKTKQDYLQIFNLVPVDVDGVRLQKIIHTQEQPSYERVIVLNKLTQPIHAKIYVIDDGENSTMILAEER